MHRLLASMPREIDCEYVRSRDWAIECGLVRTIVRRRVRTRRRHACLSTADDAEFLPVSRSHEVICVSAAGNEKGGVGDDGKVEAETEVAVQNSAVLARNFLSWRVQLLRTTSLNVDDSMARCVVDMVNIVARSFSLLFRSSARCS